jgi:MFS family permease
MTYSVDVITADATKLKNRGLAFAFTSSPYMITAFAGPKASEGFYDNISWRWGFGAFSIILPFVATPLFSILKFNLRRAEKEGILVRRSTDRTVLQSILHYTLELDGMTCPFEYCMMLTYKAPGVFLFASGLVIFLLPFSLADSAPNGWSTSYIIAMIVLGIFLLVIFGLYEAYLAPQPMLSLKILTNRTVIGACLLCFSYQVSYYCWASYFTSFLQVVNGLSISTAGYVSSTFDVVSGFLLLSVGFIIRKTGYFRWLLFIAVPLYVFAQGLMIYFRQPNRNIGYLVMCQIFLSMGGSVIILCEQLAVLAAGDHQHVAALLALLYVVGNIGGAVGNSISGAIWTNTFGQALARYLPEDAQSSLEDIYSSLETQLSYEWDSPERIGIQNAYAYAQQRMLIAGTAIMALCFVWIFLIKNLNLAKIHQTRGNVF